MSVLLDLGYVLAFVVLSPWILYRLVQAGDWRDLAMRFGVRLGGGLSGSVWLHGSSAGEVSLLKPLVEHLERDMPDTPIVVSAFTSTGLAAARRLYSRHRVILFPLDFSFVVQRCLRHFDPRLVVIVESEFWPNFISAARRRGVPVAVLNGKMSAKSFRIHARTRLIPKVLCDLSLIAVQTEEHARRLVSLGVAERHVRVTGNMKYDRAQARADTEGVPGVRESLGYEPDDVIVIGGSLHAREDEALLDAYRAIVDANRRAALVIVPRYPADAPGVKQHALRRGYAAVCKTSVDRGEARPPGRTGVLIIDTVGELGTLYGIADIAFVGGSLFYRGSNKGGHNLMEPAVLSVPVVFGPYNFSFKETADDLVAADAGILVRDASELGAALAALAADGRRRRELGARARKVVRSGQGATRRNYGLIVELLASHEGRLQAPGFDSTIPRAARGADSS